MMTLLVTVQIQGEKSAEFESLFSEIASIVRSQEPGTREYRLVRSRANRSEYRVVESYGSQEAFDAHRNNPDTKPLMGRLGALLAGKPALEFFDEVAPAA
jgi:quinol monooxygenase YgiN